MTVNPLNLHWEIKGNFLLNCNCDVFCNCPMSLGKAVPNSPNGKCFSWWGINIEEGYAEEKWSGFNPIKREVKGIMDLSGLNVAILLEYQLQSYLSSQQTRPIVRGFHVPSNVPPQLLATT